ncbi:MAG: lipocalin-like domain-containing protein [Acidobacteriales bacterium]|nr:lipocalin-like domain-containing protein [Terriglobales bacterium]
MRKMLCWIAAVLLAIAVPSVAGAQSSMNTAPDKAAMRDKLIGAWRLAWLEEQGTDGKTARVERTGTLLYTPDGHMSVQIMAPKGQADAPSNPVQYGEGGYEAYFGTFEVNEEAKTVTHHVQGALVRSLIGKDLTRMYRMSGNQLVLTSSRPDEHWTIAWEHY